MYNRVMQLEDDGSLDYEAEHYNETHEPIDYGAEYAQWLEYNDCIQCGFYNRQHALAVYGNAENGVIYYCTDDLDTIALGYVYE